MPPTLAFDPLSWFFTCFTTLAFFRLPRHFSVDFRSLCALLPLRHLRLYWLSIVETLSLKHKEAARQSVDQSLPLTPGYSSFLAGFFLYNTASASRFFFDLSSGRHARRLLVTTMRPAATLMQLALAISSVAPVVSAWPNWLPEREALIVRADSSDDSTRMTVPSMTIKC